MATCEAMYFKGHKIGAIANIAVQGVGVKGGILTDDGTGVWRSADGLVSFTPANSAIGSAITGAFVAQSGNIISIEFRVESLTISNGDFGTIAGVTLPPINGIAGSTRMWSPSETIWGTFIDGGGSIKVRPNSTYTSASFFITLSYAVPASGSVNPADSKTMLVDNDNPDLGSVFDNLGLKMITDTSVTITQLGTDQPAGTIRAYGFPNGAPSDAPPYAGTNSKLIIIKYDDNLRGSRIWFNADRYHDIWHGNGVVESTSSVWMHLGQGDRTVDSNATFIARLDILAAGMTARFHGDGSLFGLPAGQYFNVEVTNATTTGVRMSLIATTYFGDAGLYIGKRGATGVNPTWYQAALTAV